MRLKKTGLEQRTVSHPGFPPECAELPAPLLGIEQAEGDRPLCAGEGGIPVCGHVAVAPEQGRARLRREPRVSNRVRNDFPGSRGSLRREAQTLKLKEPPLRRGDQKLPDLIRPDGVAQDRGRDPHDVVPRFGRHRRKTEAQLVQLFFNRLVSADFPEGGHEVGEGVRCISCHWLFRD